MQYCITISYVARYYREVSVKCLRISAWSTIGWLDYASRSILSRDLYFFASFKKKCEIKSRDLEDIAIQIQSVNPIVTLEGVNWFFWNSAIFYGLERQLQFVTPFSAMGLELHATISKD